MDLHLHAMALLTVLRVRLGLLACAKYALSHVEVC